MVFEKAYNNLVKVNNQISTEIQACKNTISDYQSRITQEESAIEFLNKEAEATQETTSQIERILGVAKKES